MALKILHIAPQNFAGMPIDFVKMHRASGFESNLITLYRNAVNFEEDICLNFKLPENKLSKKWRDSKIDLSKPGEQIYSSPKNYFEKIFFKFRDYKNKSTIYDAVDKYKLFDYDVYHFDGGMDLFRDCRFAKELKRAGKKIVCCYFGSDLRVRGMFRELDEISDLNLTVEFDHLKIHKNINYIFFPFDTDSVKAAQKKNGMLKIVHSPTNRKYKGTEKIIKVIEKLKREREFEFILLENMERSRVLEIKSQCDIAIDQVGGESGGTGYGKNSIETLTMGIPTVSEFTEDYLKFIPDSPFINSNEDNLSDNLKLLIDNEDLRRDLIKKGKAWVKLHHSYSAVNDKLMELYRMHKIF
ncbi:MAG: hypothetical protein HGGPFJEG_01221 [Ignavibacteria bacterium]|nr:hypothetical protein [Ignavibacteria bacterium]